MADADVKIRYEFLPTENSIRESAQRVLKIFNEKSMKQKWGTGIYSEAYHKQINKVMKQAVPKISNEYKKTTDSIINLLRATQQKTSLQTKILAGLKIVEGKGITGGVSGEGAVGAGAGGIAGGGMLAALGIIAGLLAIIAIATTLISAFFEAIGPIIKVVVKMIGGMILILLMPFLKRGLPVLFGILKAMIEFSKTISGFVDSFLSYIEKLGGRIAGGDPLAIVELIIGPLGMFGLFLIKKLGEFLAGLDWGAIISSIIPAIETVFSFFNEMIKNFVIKVFGKETWTKIQGAILFIASILKPEGIWEKIKNAIDFIGTEVFGKDIWEKIKTSIAEIDSLMKNEWASIIQTLKDIGAALAPIAASFQLLRPSVGIASAVSRTSGLGTGLIAGIGHSIGSALGLFGTGKVNQDFISRPGGGMQSFSSGDTIIGTKNPGALGGVNITNHLTVSAGVDRGEFRKLLTEFSRQQARDLRTRTSYYGR